LKVIGALVGRATLLNDDDIDVPIEMFGFTKQMDGEERTRRPTDDDGNAIAVLEAPGKEDISVGAFSGLESRRVFPQPVQARQAAALQSFAPNTRTHAVVRFRK